MKKTVLFFGVTLLFSLTSCSPSIEEQAKEFAELQCKSSKLTAKMLKATTEENYEKITLLTSEAAQLAAKISLLSDELEGKVDEKEFEKELLKAMAETDCK